MPPYKGLKVTSGNFAHGFGGLYTIPLGPRAEFCIYHLVELNDGEERGGTDAPLFHFETFEVGEEPKGTNETSSTPAPEEPASEIDDEKKKEDRRHAKALPGSQRRSLDVPLGGPNPRRASHRDLL